MFRSGSRHHHRLARFGNGLLALWLAISLQWMLLPAEVFSLGEECVMACSLTGDRSCCCSGRESAEHSKHGSHSMLSRPELEAPGGVCPTLATSVADQRVDGKPLLRSRFRVAVELDASGLWAVAEASDTLRRVVDLSTLPRPPPSASRSRSVST